MAPQKESVMRPNREYGYVRPPSAEQLQRYAARHRISLTDEEAAELVPIAAETVAGFDVIDELPEPQGEPIRFTNRDPGRPPLPGEDPYNAFIRFCRVTGADSGPLAGLTAAVKDCIAIAGMPLTNGSRMLPTITPTEDATVVERILAAGATIIGKTNMEDMAMGIGEGSVYGPARNPINPRFNTGGSSSGSGAAVAAGMADFALGADEGGSVRIPAAWCGLVGMKATHGLVPSYGLSYMDHTIDHIGPLTATVELNAKVLEVIAGADWRDPQWVRADPQADSYASTLDQGVQGMTFLVIEEALEPIGATPDVLEAFEAGCDALRRAGATIERVSIPLWSSAWAIENALLTFAGRAMADSYGAGYGHKGRISVPVTEVIAAQQRTTNKDLAILSKINLMLAEHMREEYLGVHYGKAQNLRIELTKQVQLALGDGRVLLTPTIPTVAGELTDRRLTMTEMLPRLAGSAVFNTCPLDLTGHPALTVPCGTGDHGLPVGFQLIGAPFDEGTLYRAAAEVERAGLWSLPAGAAVAPPSAV